MEHPSLSALVQTVTDCATSAASSLPSTNTIVSPVDGISLLDTKNELLLSYLHNLVFLIILRLRGEKLATSDGAANGETGAESGSLLGQQTVKKLVELRLLLEKGVRPLEGKLRYQIEKVLKAADQAGHRTTSSTATTDAANGAAPSELSFRPNPLAISRPKDATSAARAALGAASESAPYRPPRINPTSMPIDQRTTKRVEQSSTLTEFLTTELSLAPVAEPSIGTTIRSSGRKNLSSKERAHHAERTRYEEENMTRLPTVTGKKEKKPKQRNIYGGEEFLGLGHGADRISRLTAAGSKRDSAAERLKKRPAEPDERTLDAPGARWDKRRKALDKRK